MPTNPKEKKPLTEEEKTKHIEKIKEEVEKHRQSVKEGDNSFASATEEQLREKLGRVNSPMIVSAGWSNSAAPGAAINFNVAVYNPDPVDRGVLYCYVFIGPGNVVADTGLFLLNVDARFPRLTEPQYGFALRPTELRVIQFLIKIPSVVESGSYMGNVALLEPNVFDVGTYLDRGQFVFRVT